jgi:hypothetical protein
LELKDVGCSCRQLKDAGFSALQLCKASFTLADLDAAGYGFEELKSIYRYEELAQVYLFFLGTTLYYLSLLEACDVCFGYLFFGVLTHLF